MRRNDRLFGILLRLRGGQVVSATELASAFEVTARTIYRDVDALSAMGVPIYAERGRTGGFRLLDGYFLPALAFTQEEATSLALGVAMLRGQRLRPYTTALESAERKLLAAMPERLSATLAQAARFIGFEADPEGQLQSDTEISSLQDPPLEAERNAVDTFLGCILSGTQVRLRYRSPYRAEASEVTAAPRAIFSDRQRWYLVGEPVDRAGETRLWRADRVIEIDATNQPVTENRQFDLRRLLGRAWLRSAMSEWSREAPVRIKLTTKQADRLRQDWYYRHAGFDQPEAGQVMMTFGEDRQEYVFELLRWLGQGAELLEPAEWRRSFQQEMAAMAAAYGTGEEN